MQRRSPDGSLKHQEAALGFWRRSLPWVAGIVVLAFAGIHGGLWLAETRSVANLPARSAGTPNVLIIVVDTLRADHLSCYDSKRITSPNLDRIAQQGILFENAFSTCPWTLPSHASLLTGRYPHDHGAQGPDPLGEQHPTLAEVLRSRGYRTAAFSANELFFCRDKGFGRGFIRFEDHFHSIVDMAACTFYGHKIARGLSRRLCLGDDPTRRPADDINRAALDWIDRDQRRPFFVFLNYFDTHDPYLPRQPFRTKFSKSRHRGGIINGYRGRERPKMTADQLQSEIDAYDGAIAFVDEQIGRLMAELKNRALSDKTLVAITSDHGESFGEHGLVNHRNALFREVIHVPLVIRWPTQLPAGVRIERPVSNASLAATVMDLIGENEVSPFPLRTLSPLWKSPAAWSEWPHPLAEMAQVKGAEVPDIRVPGHLGSMKCLVTPQWHYIHHETLGTELFEWKNDPRETRNLVKTLAGKAVAEALASEFEDHTSEVRLNGSRVNKRLYAQESVPE